MPALLSRPVTPAERERNAACHRPLIVAAVLAMLGLYAYLVTHAAVGLGLPLPEELARRAGLALPHVFDADGNVDSEIWIIYGDRRYTNDDQRLIFFAVVAAAFLCAYFLPVRHKRTSLVLAFLVAGGVLFGVSAVAGLVAAHLVIYLLFHTPPPVTGIAILGGAGSLLGVALAAAGRGDPVQVGAWTVLAAVAYGYRLPQQSPRALAVLRTLAVQSALLTVLIGALAHGLGGAAWTLPLGVLLFFWQWERLMLYHVDHAAGRVPPDLPLLTYLSVFLTPAVMPNWNWGVAIGQGYAYLEDNFLAEDKNRLALEGVKIWAVALGYLVLGDWLRYQLVGAFTALGVEVHQAQVKALVCEYVRTGTATTGSVLATTMLDLFRWYVLWAAAMHFKTGLWRIFGYRMDPYFHHPWRATNLVAFWSRFTFHYREFLVRAFYYPVFFRYFRGHTTLRVVAATVAAAGVGNLIWGHLPEAMYYRGPRVDALAEILTTWPYFLLLSLGIAVTELYLLSKTRTRKPWTLDRRLPLDVLACYLTIQFYALIEIFMHPCRGGSLADSARLFLIGLGLSW